MKLLWGDKDGGPESRVWCWGLEIKSLFSVILMNFKEGSREAYHTHAFNSLSWVLYGELVETTLRWTDDSSKYLETVSYKAGILPIKTYRSTCHKVSGVRKNNWVLSFRGPWVARWKEFLPLTKTNITLTHGRKEVSNAAN